MQEKIARGEVLQSWSRDDFPIGLDSNFEPFPSPTPSGSKDKISHRSKPRSARTTSRSSESPELTSNSPPADAAPVAGRALAQPHSASMCCNADFSAVVTVNS